MRYFKSVRFLNLTVIFFAAMTFLNSAHAELKTASFDLRRALPNNSTPPERKTPLNILPALNKNEGIIRRVKISDDNLKVVALTFDMCELDTVTTGCDIDSMNFLIENKIPATLFIGGKWARTHSRRVKELMLENLFEFANHNWSHGNCALLSEKGLKAQILWTQAQYELLREELEFENLNNNMQKVPVLFRLPYGRSSESALKIIDELGLRVIQWDVAAEAGDNSNLKRAKSNAKKVVSMTKSGSILLFHANLVPKGTVNLLRYVVEELQARDYKFVTVSELLTLGEPECVKDGYFSYKGDNKALDKKFGIDGTGRRYKFIGE